MLHTSIIIFITSSLFVFAFAVDYQYAQYADVVVVIETNPSGNLINKKNLDKLLNALTIRKENVILLVVTCPEISGIANNSIYDTEEQKKELIRQIRNFKTSTNKTECKYKMNGTDLFQRYFENKLDTRFNEATKRNSEWKSHPQKLVIKFDSEPSTQPFQVVYNNIKDITVNKFSDVISKLNTSFRDCIVIANSSTVVLSNCIFLNDERKCVRKVGLIEFTEPELPFGLSCPFWFEPCNNESDCPESEKNAWPITTKAAAGLTGSEIGLIVALILTVIALIGAIAFAVVSKKGSRSRKINQPTASNQDQPSVRMRQIPDN